MSTFSWSTGSHSRLRRRSRTSVFGSAKTEQPSSGTTENPFDLGLYKSIWPHVVHHMTVLDDISKQLHLCAALMSDPTLMRYQSAMIAGQFVVAMNRIEQLRQFLRKPDQLSECENGQWLDASILDSGIKKMVEQILNRQMATLKQNKFPEVFYYRLGNTDDGITTEGDEDLVQREIKETNCMGAMLLLYYYVFWHMMLIHINRLTFPCHFVSKELSADGDLNFKTFINEKLPKETDMLELRFLRKMFEGGDVVNVPMASDFMMDKTDKRIPSSKPRVSNILRAFKRVIRNALNNRSYQNYFEIQDERTVCAMTRVISCRGITLRLELFKNVISTFQLQDDLTLWDDMYKPIQIQTKKTSENDTEDVSGFTRFYEFKLIDVLSSRPLFKNGNQFFNLILKELAIHDFTAASLMMDVSRSFIRLATMMKLFHDSNTSNLQLNMAYCKMMAQTFSINPKVIYFLKNTYRNARKVKQEFIYDQVNSNRNTIEIPQNVLDSEQIRIDNLAALYWNARSFNVGANNNNYLYFAWPGVSDTESLAWIQNASKEFDKNANVFSLAFLVPAIRNTLFITNISKSSLELMHKLKRSPIFKAEVFSIQRDDLYWPDLTYDLNVANNTYVDYFKEADYTKLNNCVVNNLIDLSNNIIEKNLLLEQAELLKYYTLIQNRKFTKYPGISWPVQALTDGEAISSNEDCFEETRRTPKASPSLERSAERAVYVLEKLANPRVINGITNFFG